MKIPTIDLDEWQPGEYLGEGCNKVAYEATYKGEMVPHLVLKRGTWQAEQELKIQQELLDMLDDPLYGPAARAALRRLAYILGQGFDEDSGNFWILQERALLIGDLTGMFPELRTLWPDEIGTALGLEPASVLEFWDSGRLNQGWRDDGTAIILDWGNEELTTLLTMTEGDDE